MDSEEITKRGDARFNKKRGTSTPKTKWQKVRKPLGILLFVILNVVVIVLAAVSEFGNSSTASELNEVHMNGWFLIPAALCFVVANLANIYKYVLMIRRAYPKNQCPHRRQIWKTAWRVVMLGKYYDNVTPAAVGGQPFQIYYMHKNSGVSSGHATSIPIFGMIAGQIAFLILAIICFLFGNINENPALAVVAWLGLLFYAFWPIMVAGVSFFPKPTTKFLKFITKIFAKIKIVKNREEALARIERNMDAYADSVKAILKTRGLFLNTLILALIYTVFTAAIPYFVLTAFGGQVGFIKTLVLTMAVTSAVYFVPTPGNSGAAEGTFFMVFSALSDGYVFWAMLVWRFFSYYIYILMGPLTYFAMRMEKRKELSNVSPKKRE